MKNSLMPIAVILSALFVLTSCLGDDDDDTVYPSDAAITAFSLGTLNRYITKTSSTGADSVVKSTVSGSSYRLYIDQINRTIYNPDSLPYGTDVKHVVCSIVSKNSGTVLIKSLISDTLFYYSSTDSIDFSEPRRIAVNSLDGKNFVYYTVNINVHKEEADTFYWQNIATLPDITSVKGMKAIPNGGRIFLFCSGENTGGIYSTPATDGANWSLMAWNLNMPVPANVAENVVAMKNSIYLYANGLILRSTDGMNWETTGQAELHRLVAASSTKLYALDEGDNLISSSDEGVTWVNEQLDTTSSLLPTTDLSFICTPSRVDEDTEIITLIGNRSEGDYPGDTQAQVWSKIVDYSIFSTHDPWMYVNPNDMASRMLPRLSSLTIVNYDKGIIAAGGKGRGACQEEGFQHFYYSNDGGVYWNHSATCFFPEGFECGDVFTMAKDSDNYLWLFCGQSGQVWKGRKGAYSGEEIPTSFTK